jgi:hypothetical protein
VNELPETKQQISSRSVITKVKELDKELFTLYHILVCCPVHNALVSTNVTHAVATNVQNAGTFSRLMRKLVAGKDDTQKD